MLSRLNILLPLVLLAVLALLSFWINTSVQEPSRKLDGSSRHDPDYIVENFVTRKTDVDGKIRYMLASVNMTHYPDDQSTLLTRPRFTQYATDLKDGKFYTQIEGLSGHVTENGKQIEVKDNVKVYRPAYNGKGDMTMTTAKLTILPDDGIAKTDLPVVITQSPKTKVTAVGMVFNKKDKTIKLLSHVKVHYENPIIADNNATKEAAALAKKRGNSKKTQKLQLSGTDLVEARKLNSNKLRTVRKPSQPLNLKASTLQEEKIIRR